MLTSIDLPFERPSLPVTKEVHWTKFLIRAQESRVRNQVVAIGSLLEAPNKFRGSPILRWGDVHTV